MNYLLRSFQISCALHVFIVLLLIVMGDRFVSSEKLMVIDFTLEDSIDANKTRSGAVIRDQIQRRPIHTTKSTKQEPEVAESTAEIVPRTMPPVTRSQQSPTAETQMPVLAHGEITAPSTKGEQDISGRGIASVSGIPVTASERIKAGSGGGSENADAAGRIKYLKANFSYIKDLINRKITYPKTARQMGWEGKVKVSFIISSDGYAKGIKILWSSGIESLDKNAVEAVKSASPFPKPPVEAQIIIPILYRLN